MLLICSLARLAASAPGGARLAPSRAASGALVKSLPENETGSPNGLPVSLAEKERFELSRRYHRPTPLAGAPLRPLEYFSVYSSQAAGCIGLRPYYYTQSFPVCQALFGKIPSQIGNYLKCASFRNIEKVAEFAVLFIYKLILVKKVDFSNWRMYNVTVVSQSNFL